MKIGDWELHADRNEVTRDGLAVRLEPKAIEVLAYLARFPGRVVSREELLTAAWPGVIVGDDALTQVIIKLRKALGDDAHNPKYIETISKRGYRLVALTSELPAAPPSTRGAAGTLPAGLPPSQVRRKPPHVAMMIGGAVVGILVIAAFIAYKTAPMPWPIATDTRGGLAVSPPIVAVLPLTNLSGDPKRDYFSDGLTEDIISALGRFSALRVMSRNAVEPFRKGDSPQAVLTQLGARYVVKGSVREEGGRLRVAVELSDTSKGIVLWSERYDGQGEQVFEIQDRIVKDIAAALAVRLTSIERERAAQRPVESLEAYDLVLRARELTYRMTRETNRQARTMLARAIELAPNYGEAYVTLAHAEYRRADQGWMEDYEDGMRRVEAHARRALALADTGAHSRAHSQLARVHGNRRDLDQALAEAQRAVELNPSDPVAHYALGSVLVWLGRLQEGLAGLQTARRFDPTLDDVMTPIAYYTMGRYEQAAQEARDRIARYPDIVVLRAARAASLGQLAREAEAREEVAQIRRLSPFARVELFVPGFRNSEHAAKFHEGLRKAGL